MVCSWWKYEEDEQLLGAMEMIKRDHIVQNNVPMELLPTYIDWVQAEFKRIVASEPKKPDNAQAI